MPGPSIRYGRMVDGTAQRVDGWYCVREGRVAKAGTVPLGLGQTWALTENETSANVAAAAPEMRRLLMETIPAGVALTHFPEWRRRVLQVLESIDGKMEDEIMIEVLSEGVL